MDYGSLTGVKDMTHSVSKIKTLSALRLAAVAALGIATSGCVYDGGASLGYASDGYAQGCDSYDNFDSYYDCDYGYGFSNIGYGGGWYSDYYYPGYGYFIFDSYGRRYQMQQDHLRYWGGQRYNWYRQHGGGRGNYGNGGGYGHNDGGNHNGGYGGGGHHNGGNSGHDNGGQHGNHGGNGQHYGNGGQHDGNGQHGGNVSNGNGDTPRRGQLEGGFGRPSPQQQRQQRVREGIKNYGNTSVGGTVSGTANTPPPRTFDDGNRGDKALNNRFRSQSQGGGAAAQPVRQSPAAARAPAPQSAPRPAPQTRGSSIRNERSEGKQDN